MSHNDPSNPSAKKSGSDAYWIPGALIAASLLLGVGITVYPQTAGAFWPFTVLKAAEPAGAAPIVHDSSIDMLESATNPDPSPEGGISDISTSEGAALIANAGVDGTVPSAEHAVTGGSITSYTVQPGDSISAIAADHGVSVDTILWANSLTRKSAIKPGMTLVILPVSGVRHTVTKGETLASIAKKFDADAADIASYNGLENNEQLIIGTALIIPGGEMTAAAIATTKPASTGTKTTIKTGGSMGAVRAVGDTSRSEDLINPLPAGHLSQGIHGWNGVDIAAPKGTPIYAAAGGTVIVSRVGGWNGGYGNYVVIDHGDGTQTLYGHLTSDSVSVGQSVSQGQPIGTVGNTGKATGYHLHFEVRGARNPFAN